MRFFADTNWLVAAYFPEKFPVNAAVVERFAARHDYPWHISHPILTECSNVFRNIAGEPKPIQWMELQQDCGEGIIVSPDSWEKIARIADGLIAEYGHRARLGTLDLLIVASALSSDATHFLSFDTNSHLRALAAVLKMKVFPELSADDRRRMAALR